MYIQKVIAAYTPGTLDVGQVTVDSVVGTLTFEEIFTNIIDTLSSSIFFVSAAVFVYGAFLYIASAFREESKNSGKEYMIASIIGLLFVLSARAILNAVMMFIYGI